MNSTYWTDQQTGEPIGPLYSWSDVRQMQLDDDIRKMLKRKQVTEPPQLLSIDNETHTNT